MDRRRFLRNSALIAAGAIAADQLEILDRLNHKKVFTTGGFDPQVWLFDPIAGPVVEEAGLSPLGFIKTRVPKLVTMTLADYRRKYGLRGHVLAFDVNGDWMVGIHNG